MKETDFLLEICEYTDHLMAAKRANPGFAVEFAAELAKRGLQMGETEVIFTSAAESQSAHRTGHTLTASARRAAILGSASSF